MDFIWGVNICGATLTLLCRMCMLPAELPHMGMFYLFAWLQILPKGALCKEVISPEGRICEQNFYSSGTSYAERNCSLKIGLWSICRARRKRTSKLCGWGTETKWKTNYIKENTPNLSILHNLSKIECANIIVNKWGTLKIVILYKRRCLFLMKEEWTEMTFSPSKSVCCLWQGDRERFFLQLQ